jgi:endonuclease-3
MRINELHEELIALHGEPSAVQSDDGVRQLVTTILSQNVADIQTSRAAANLFTTYDSYEEIENAPQDELAEVISQVGLMNQKSERIQNALSRVREEVDGGYSIEFLREMETERAKDWLTDITGIGPKTASVVLNFHFDKPVFAVDTHVERLSKRFGFVDESLSPEGVHEEMNEIVPDNNKYSLHVLMITHGREYCTAQSPDCQNPVCERFCGCEHC